MTGLRRVPSARMRVVRLAASVALAATLAAAVLAAAAPAHGLGADNFAVPADATELIVVSSPTYDPPNGIATLRTYERANPWSPWTEVFPAWGAETGVGHLRNVRREGDGSTPTGVFDIGTTMYGNDANPGGLHEAYHHLVCGDWWDEDPWSGLYNRFVHVACGTTPSFAPWSEALWTESVAYPYFAVLETNNDPIVGGAKAPGSGIFLHSWIGEPTQGCVALHRPDLLAVLRWLNPRDHPVIEIGTAAEVGRLPPPGSRLASHVAVDPSGGYWMAAAGGQVLSERSAPRLGSPVSTDADLLGPVTAIAADPAKAGYLVGTGAGQVFGYGAARWHGSPAHDHRPLGIASIAMAPSGHGYYVATDRGNVFTYGGAVWSGSPSARHEQVTATAIALERAGYWVASASGRVMEFGVGFYGSPASRHRRLTTPVTGILPTRDGKGYLVVTSGGNVFAYGDAVWRGSLAGTRLAGRVVAISARGQGYELFVENGVWPHRPREYVFTR